jgi:hypothetical protein
MVEVVMLSVNMLNVVMLSVIMASVMVPEWSTDILCRHCFSLKISKFQEKVFIESCPGGRWKKKVDWFETFLQKKFLS